MKPGKYPFNPWDIKDPETAQLNALQAKTISNQQQMLLAQQMNIHNAAGPDIQQSLAPLIGLVDQWTGSKMGQSYKAPETGSQKLDKVQALEAGLANAQNVLADNQLGQLKSKLAEKKEARDTQLKYLMHLETMANAKNIADIKAGVVKKGKPISPTQISELGALKELPKSLDANFNDWVNLASSPGSAVQSIIPNTPANIYEAKRLQAGTNFGKAMLGNARSHEMLMTHVKMLPGASDTEDKAKSKISQAKQAVVDKYNEKLASFKQGGYDTGTLEPLTLKDLETAPPDAPQSDMKTYQGKNYKLKPGTDRYKQENWVVE